MELETIVEIKNKMFQAGLNRPNRLLFLIEMLEEDFYQNGIELFDKENRLKENKELKKIFFQFTNSITKSKEEAKQLKLKLIEILTSYNKNIINKTINHSY